MSERYNKNINFNEFKPNFKQLMFKQQSNLVDKKVKFSMQKSNFNHFRAISTSSGYRKASFQRLLETLKEKEIVNPEIQRLDL